VGEVYPEHPPVPIEMTAREKKRAYDRARYEKNRGAVCARVKEYREANPELIREHKRAYFAANRDREHARAKACYEAKRAERIAKSRAWVVANREWVRERQRAWLSSNRDKDAQRRVRRRARKQGARVCDFNETQWREIVAYFGGRCAYCGEPSGRLEREHMQPLSRGGEHTAANIVPSCRTCNASKHTKTLIEWLQAAGQTFQQLRLEA
jgi:hypothetical protein